MLLFFPDLALLIFRKNKSVVGLPSLRHRATLSCNQLNQNNTLRSCFQKSLQCFLCVTDRQLWAAPPSGHTQVHRFRSALSLLLLLHLPSLLLIPLPSLPCPSRPPPPGLPPSLSPSLIQMQRAVSNRMRADLIQKASLKISASGI